MEPEKMENIDRPLDEQKNTLLHLAAIYQNKEAIKKLLEQGANPQKRNAFSFSFYDLAYYLLEQNTGENRIGIYSQKEHRIKYINEKQFEAFFSVKYLDHLQFASYSALQWVYEKNERQLKKGDVNKTNHWTRALLEKELRKKSLPDIYIKWINAFIGYGIFAAKDIPEYTFIGEYSGLIKRRRRRRDLGNDYIFGYVTGPSDTPYMIDAEKYGNFVRFINHSDEPNLTSRWIISDNISHIVLFANRFIPKDTQLTYDYGPYYWKRRSSPVLL